MTTKNHVKISVEKSELDLRNVKIILASEVPKMNGMRQTKWKELLDKIPPQMAVQIQQENIRGILHHYHKNGFYKDLIVTQRQKKTYIINRSKLKDCPLTNELLELVRKK